MENEINVSLIENDIAHKLGINITSHCFESSIEKNKYLAKSATILVDNQTHEQFYFCGGAIRSNIDEALKISRFEVLERVLAMPQIHHEKISKGGGFDTFEFLTGRKLPDASPREVLLYAKDAIEQREQSYMLNVDVTANGLAIHTNPTLAIEHAAFELIERHISCNIWYDNHTFIIAIGNEKNLPDGYSLTNYTLFTVPSIPYVLSIIRDREGHVFLTGSAVRKSLASACIAAELEALMTLENVINKWDSKFANMYDSLEIVNSLSGELAMKRLKHFQNKIIERTDKLRYTDTNLTLTVEKIVEGVFNEPNLLTISVIFHSFGVFLVRARSPEALQKRKLRLQFQNSMIPLDPFC